MSTSHIILGVDDRIDETGIAQPWRIVVMGRAVPGERRQYLMSLPSDRRYFSPPRHPLYGDLTRIGSTFSESIEQLVRDLSSSSVSNAHMDERHRRSVIGRTMIWNGIEPRGHEIADVPEGMLRDPYSIGGEAGHQIAMIEFELRKTR